MKVQIQQWELELNIEQTKAFYASFPYNNEDEFGLNYIQVCSFCTPEVINFFQQLGIDLLKPTNLNYLPIEGDCIMYSGSYHVIGERLQGELDEWDMAVDSFCFSLTECNFENPQSLIEPVLEISFEVVLPWMLVVPFPVH